MKKLVGTVFGGGKARVRGISADFAVVGVLFSRVK